ncbi:MAG TPA: hypothetical protein VHB97_26615, partial [Polyangia bacterium]|nr:hypothetical protein [Polyangia bacterium]
PSTPSPMTASAVFSSRPAKKFAVFTVSRGQTSRLARLRVAVDLYALHDGRVAVIAVVLLIGTNLGVHVDV